MAHGPGEGGVRVALPERLAYRGCGRRTRCESGDRQQRFGIDSAEKSVKKPLGLAQGLAFILVHLDCQCAFESILVHTR